MQINLTISPVANHTQDWPAWTDEERWGLGPEPSPADRQWWAENSPAHEEWHDLDGPEADDDDWPPIDENEALQAAWDASNYFVG
ncbi:hypothetical protein BH23PLA1_BH23PLA1_29520 [soil metagenome]